MVLEKLIDHPNVEKKSDGTISLKLPVNKDNNSIFSGFDTYDNGYHITDSVDIETIKKVVALEGPIFRPAVQAFQMMIASKGLELGYLCADPITFAEEFGADGSKDFREIIYNNWKKVIDNSDATLAMVEYGREIDPGVVLGGILQLARGKPVVGIHMDEKRNDIFSNSIDNLRISRDDVIEIIHGSKNKIRDILWYTTSSTSDKLNITPSSEKKYDVLIVSENTIEGTITSEGLETRLICEGVNASILSEINREVKNVYDLSDVIRESKKVVIIGDNTSEPGITGSCALQLSSLMGIESYVLRGDFRKLTGEGEGAGMNQPDKGLRGAVNLMIDYLCPNGLYTKSEALIYDLLNK